jgi:hypothetical protein
VAAFGTITQTYDPRQIQFGVKLSYWGLKDVGGGEPILCGHGMLTKSWI